MAMITETIYAGRNNTFSLQLIRAGEPINLLSITGYQLVLPGETAAEDIIFTNLDLANAAELLLRGEDKNAPVSCAVMSGRILDGTFVPQIFVVDSAQEKITGKGEINFRDER